MSATTLRRGVRSPSRAYYAGERDMPISDDHTMSTVFIYGRSGQLDGTGFIVTLAGTHARHGYVVTAKHVAYSDAGDEQAIAVAARTTDGVLQKPIPVGPWFPHPEGYDVAVAPFLRETDRRNFFGVNLNEQAADVINYEPVLGHPVYYLGLMRTRLSQQGGTGALDEMALRGIPMVRSGTLGAISQPVRFKDGATRLMHLIDCRSYHGFSGSPVYLNIARPGKTVKPPVLTSDLSDDIVESLGAIWHAVCLYGVLVAHVDDLERDADAPMPYRYNLGVGIVVPIERVRECLNVQELVRMRDNDIDGTERSTEIVESGSADSAYTFADFDRDLRQVTRKLDGERSDPEASGTEA